MNLILSKNNTFSPSIFSKQIVDHLPKKIWTLKKFNSTKKILKKDYYKYTNYLAHIWGTLHLF